MEATNQNTNAKAKELPSLSFKKSQEFISEVKDEVKKINWTSPEELRLYTKIVVAATFILGMVIYFIDIIIQILLNGLAVLTRMIGA